MNKWKRSIDELKQKQFQFNASPAVISHMFPGGVNLATSKANVRVKSNDKVILSNNR